MTSEVWRDLPAYAPVQCDLATLMEALPSSCSSVDAVMSDRALHVMKKHALAEAPAEVMGLLLGRALQDVRSRHFVTVVDSVLALSNTRSTSLAVQADDSSWSQAWGRIPHGAQVVGWYHSHPGHGIFFSATDRKTQRDHFAKPWSVGLVIDPSDESYGIFTGALSDTGSVRVLEEGTLLPLLSLPATARFE